MSKPLKQYLEEARLSCPIPLEGEIEIVRGKERVAKAVGEAR
jgi:hypothetical protein